MATAKAITNCVLLYITRADFLNFLRCAPELVAEFNIKIKRTECSLNDVLVSSTSYIYFEMFMKKEHSEENCQFWREVEKFRKTNFLNEANLVQKVQLLYDRFISNSAPQQVNLPAGCQSELVSRMTESPPRISLDIFNTAQSEIYHLMNRDNFSRFRSSDIFKLLLQELQAYTTAYNTNVTLIDPVSHPLLEVTKPMDSHSNQEESKEEK